ncbi:MAG: hypothetical protein H6825_01900 [Planctomycetes bacterium]|nr:hypothetical protein [Planctomycetota bacterium]
MRSHPVLVASFLCAAVASASAADLVVGGGSPYATIDAAMASARPGDRILVMPGSYPAFQFNKGVHVHGMGNDPGDVVVARVDYHVSDPSIGYDSTLSNMTLQASTATPGYLAVTGNELPPGVLVLDGMIIKGGVFLGGGAADGFSLLLANSRVEPSAGQGFLGSTMSVGGPKNTVEIVDSSIDGADADPDTGLPAYSALRLAGGTRARLSNARIHGGDGKLGGTGAFVSGADAVVDGTFPQPVTLRIDGDSTIVGGSAAGVGTAGDGVDVSGSIDLGDALVLGGAGTLPGTPFVDAQPVDLPVEPYLSVSPKMLDASGATFVQTDDLVTFSMETPAASTALVLGFALDQPTAKFFTLSPVPLLVFVPGNVASLLVPLSPFAADVPGVMLYAEGLTRDATGLMHVSQTATVRVDFLATHP